MLLPRVRGVCLRPRPPLLLLRRRSCRLRRPNRDMLVVLTTETQRTQRKENFFFSVSSVSLWLQVCAFAIRLPSTHAIQANWATPDDLRIIALALHISPFFAYGPRRRILCAGWFARPGSHYRWWVA